MRRLPTGARLSDRGCRRPSLGLGLGLTLALAAACSGQAQPGAGDTSGDAGVTPISTGLPEGAEDPFGSLDEGLGGGTVQNGLPCADRCVPTTDLCVGVTCAGNQTCIEGKCVSGCFLSPCAGVTCDPGNF